MNSLFLDTEFKLSFEKIAMPVRLSESPEAWQRDIAGEIYKQIPFLGDYTVNIILDRVDAQRGFGMGSAHISNKTDAPLPDQAELPSLRIPIIIRDYIMSPLDVFMDETGEYPLTESRVREKLFRTETFELSTRKPSDKGLVDQLYPPMRTNYGMGSVGGDTMGMGKTANAAEAARRSYVQRMRSEAASNPDHLGGAKCASLLESISSTIPEKQANAFVDLIANDMALKVAAAKNESFQKLAMIIATSEYASTEKTATALVSSIRPTVVQFQKMASGNFTVKWANAEAFNPQQMTVNPAEASQMAGGDVSKMQPGAAVTVSNEKAQKQSLDEPVYVQIQQFGNYIVQDMESNAPLDGWVIPIVDLEMHPLDLYLFIKPIKEAGFSGGSDIPTEQTSEEESGSWSVQDEIAGEQGGNGMESFHSDIIEKNIGQQPQGSGVFVSWEGKCCLLPMTISNGTGQGFQGETLFGEPIMIQVIPGLKAIEMMGEGSYGIPDNLYWVPLPGHPVFLAKTPLDIENIDQAQGAEGQVQVGSTGAGEFSMEGAPLAKVAKQDKQFLKTAEAEFLLVAMGVNPFDAKEVLATAQKGYPVKVAARSITPLSVRHKEMTKQASYDLATFPYHLRKDLVKEAAVLEDADTADKVLSLSFLNPENIAMFAKSLPDLDKAAKKLASMLVAVRLGLGSVDESAVERAMKALEEVIEGLKVLQQKIVH